MTHTQTVGTKNCPVALKHYSEDNVIGISQKFKLAILRGTTEKEGEDCLWSACHKWRFPELAKTVSAVLWYAQKYVLTLIQDSNF